MQAAQSIDDSRDSLIGELESAIKSGTPEKRVETLRNVTDLFLHDADKFSEEQIEVFDDVLCLLINRIETKAKAELGERLAPIDNAPPLTSSSVSHATMKLQSPALSSRNLPGCLTPTLSKSPNRKARIIFSRFPVARHWLKA